MTINGAIMQLVEMRENSMMPMVFKPYFDKVIETISECEEPRSQPQWIPSSERLPSDSDYYLVTDSYGDVSVIWFAHEKDYYGKSEWRETEDEIIAWMPCPEPYKEGNDEIN